MNMMDFRQSQLERLEDAGVVKYGENVNSVPKTNSGTFRSRIIRGVREVVLRGNNR